MEYTDEQMQEFGEIFNKAVYASHDAVSLRDQPKVFQRRFAMKHLAERTLNNYRNLPADIQEEFGFDLEGLARDIGSFM
ncbi:MAG: hypothetical protein ABIH37_01320 [archaeon]